jgi:hypothetical protein
MPTAVTHILVPLVLMALYRDYFISDKERRSFPLHYVLIAGLGGILPDIDIGAFWILHWFGFTIEQVHRTALHSVFVPLLLVLLGFVFVKVKVGDLGRHKLTLSKIFFMLSFGSLMHIFLDGFISGDVHLFAPFLDYTIGFNLVGYLPIELSGLAIGTFEGVLLIFYLVYLEWKHKISDFI